MHRVYQKEWFGIPFATISQPRQDVLADATFYDRFYEEFFRRFDGYDQLPADWREHKQRIMLALERSSRPEALLLSIGCGIGFIEDGLARSGRKVIAVELSKPATRWLENVPGVDVRHSTDPADWKDRNGRAIDLAFVVSADYGLSNDELTGLMRSIAAVASRVIIMSYCADAGPIARLRQLLGLAATRLGVWRRGQWWGYARTEAEIGQLLRASGWRVLSTGRIDSATWFECRK